MDFIYFWNIRMTSEKQPKAFKPKEEFTSDRKFELMFKNNIDIDNRIIRLNGFIGHSDNDDSKEPCFDFNFVDTAMTLLESHSKKKAITIKINSGGGYAYEGQAILGRIKRSPCHIITEGYGRVMSAACLLLAAGNTRKMSKYCMFMSHESSYYIDGKHSEIVDYVRQQEREDQAWCRWMAELTTKDAEFWKSSINRKDFYLDAEGCLAVGVIDKIF